MWLQWLLQYWAPGRASARIAGARAHAVCLVFAALLISGCAETRLPENYEAKLFDPEKSASNEHLQNLTFSENLCPPAGTTEFMMPADKKPPANDTELRLTMRYSPGDRINILIPGSPEFSGDYMVNVDGKVLMPFGIEIAAVGLSNTELARNLENSLIQAKMFLHGGFRVSVRPVQFAPINVTVSGAVFVPGRTQINNIKDADKGEKAMTKFGDSPQDRFVASGLKAAGGVRPDADISRIQLMRRGKVYNLDWRGAFNGAPVDDVALIEGDNIVVPESNCFQSALMRPSQITPPGLRLFMSNLTQPAASNSNSAINQFSTSIPYGTRFLAGLVSANCVGGSLASNAGRYGVLISRNPKTMRTEVVQRPIELLVRSADRDSINPYLMPDDAIACYDSAITDAREVGTTLQTIFNPLLTGRGIKAW